MNFYFFDVGFISGHSFNFICFMLSDFNLVSSLVLVSHSLLQFQIPDHSSWLSFLCREQKRHGKMCIVHLLWIGHLFVVEQEPVLPNIPIQRHSSFSFHLLCIAWLFSPYCPQEQKLFSIILGIQKSVFSVSFSSLLTHLSIFVFITLCQLLWVCPGCSGWS